MIAVVDVFQSTRPRGARPKAHDRHRRKSIVSIHAPARGATRHIRHYGNGNGSFNPRAREGRDRLTVLRQLRTFPFQSTRPRGARLPYSCVSPTSLCFNPRAREGRDTPIMPALRVSSVFQSTRPRGARPAYSLNLPTIKSFNPRAREGRDRRLDRRFQNRARFNPRAREGRDLPQSARVCRILQFQSTRPRGARPAFSRGVFLKSSFNPRAREGRDQTRQLTARPCHGFNPRAREGRDFSANDATGQV